jgi:uncharacterized membrane protein
LIRSVVRWLLGLAYAVAGYLHLTAPRPFVAIVPSWVPAPTAVVLGTGVAELLGAAALLQPWSQNLRRAAGLGLALYALCVWPANFHHMALDTAKPGHGLGLAYHVPRLMAQPLIIWLALWAGEVTDWPLARRGAPTK